MLLTHQILVFGFVGALAAAVHYLSALALLEWVGLPVQVAYLAGFTLGFFVSYVGQARFTFRAGYSLRSFMSYVLLALANYMLSAAILWLLADVMAVKASIAMLVVVLSIPLLSFFISKYLIFSR